MSIQAVESVLSRAMSDSAFAELLFSNPTQALSGYDLTPDEAASFTDLARDDLAKVTGASLEERRSFGWSNHNESGLSTQLGAHSGVPLVVTDTSRKSAPDA